jgi:hypothetical protein
MDAVVLEVEGQQGRPGWVQIAYCDTFEVPGGPS